MRLGGPTQRLRAALLPALGLALALCLTSGAARALEEHDIFLFNLDGAGLADDDLEEGLDAIRTYLRAQEVFEAVPHFFDKTPTFEAFIEKSGERPPVLGVLSAAYLLNRGFQLGYRPLVCAQRDDRIAAVLALIARRGSGIDGLDDVKNRRLVMTNVGADQLAWTAVLTFGDRLALDKDVDGISGSDGPVESVMAVIYHRADVALVSKDLFQRMSERAASVWRQVKEVYTSPEMILAPVVVHESAPKELVDAVRAALLGEVDKRKGGHTMLDAFYLDGFVPCDWSDLEKYDGALLEAAGYPYPKGAAREAARRPQSPPSPTPPPTPTATPAPDGPPSSSGQGAGDGTDEEGVLVAPSWLRAAIQLDATGQSLVVTLRFLEGAPEVKQATVRYALGDSTHWTGEDPCFPTLPGRQVCALSATVDGIEALTYEVFVETEGGEVASSGRLEYRTR